MLKKNFLIFTIFIFCVVSIKAQEITDLPLVINPAKKEAGNSLVILISGDGGWITFDKQLAKGLSENGVPVVGLNALKYFWKKKTPDKTARDIAMIIQHYSKLYHKDKIVLSGFSFGSDVLPFIYNRLPKTTKDKVSFIQLISPSNFTDFEIHVNDLFSINDKERIPNVDNEIKKIDIPIYCYYGKDERDKPLKNLKMNNFYLQIIEGDHHYNNNVAKIIKPIL